MEITELDIFIIKQIYSMGVVNTWDIAKTYNWDDKKRDMTQNQKNAYLTSKNNTIEYRLKRLAKMGLIKIEKNHEKIYVLDTNRVILTKHKFKCGIRDSIQIKNKDNRWIIQQIN